VREAPPGAVVLDQAARAPVDADRGWLSRLVTRQVPLERWQDAVEQAEDDIKVVVEFAT
jgi:glucose 1-dehydrogenase